MSEVSFEGRVAVVTGGGGGLGRTYALELARRGACVVVNDLGGGGDGRGGSTAMADETVALCEKEGGKAVASYDSVASKEGGEAIIQSALDAFGRVDVVINNAGILRDKSFAKLEVEDLDAVLDVHLRGAFFVSQPAFRAMKDRGYGRFLFTSSSSGIWGNFGQANYAAAKTGLIGLSNVIAIEGARYQIHSNVIAPAASTRLTQGLGGPGDEPSEERQRLSDPRQVTALAIYLVSEDCSLSHETFAAGYGRYARVFLGLAPPWFHGAREFPTVEDVRDNIETVMSTDGFIIPKSTADEMKPVYEKLGR